MRTWHDRRILDLFGIELPIIKGADGGATTVERVMAASKSGGLGSLPSAQHSVQ
jgi:nitronate monooxygenase